MAPDIGWKRGRRYRHHADAGRATHRPVIRSRIWQRPPRRTRLVRPESKPLAGRHPRVFPADGGTSYPTRCHQTTKHHLTADGKGNAGNRSAGCASGSYADVAQPCNPGKEQGYGTAGSPQSGGWTVAQTLRPYPTGCNGSTQSFCPPEKSAL